MKHSTISVSRVRRATVEEKKDKRKGRIIAFFFHLGLLVLAIWPFLVELPEEKTAEVQIVMLDFRDPPPITQTSGSSREGASAPAKSGVERAPEPAPQPVEESAPPPPEPEPVPTPVEPEPQPTPEPEPIPEPVKPEPTPQPEIQTTKQPEPVKVPPVPPTPPKPTPKPPTPAPPKPTPPAPTPPQPAPEPVPDAAPEPEKRKPISERIADLFKDTEYSGKDDEGTGAGSTPDGKDGKDGNNTSGSNGTGNTGDGDSDKGDKANGSGDGWIEGLGSLSRARISSPPISDLVKAVGRVVVKVCINKRGKVVYAEYDAENSTLQDAGHKRRAVEHVQNIVFERNDSAPDKECGRLTFRMTRNGFEEE